MSYIYSSGFCLLIFVVTITSATKNISSERRHDARKFPEGFLFGVATSSYQIEGAWDEDGKSESIWDYLTHTDPGFVADGSNGDIADDSYHQYKRDVEMIRELGLDLYRFSLSWTRILPTSFPDKINEAGVRYYNNLINELLKYNIQPVVTIFHFDLPQKLQNMGGWTNPNIVDWYSDYARTVFELFGDRVKYWVTINEPHVLCYFGYGSKIIAPRMNIPGRAAYMCAKYALLAHAKVYHIYTEEYKPTQGGTIGMGLAAPHYEPETDNDIDAALTQHLFTLGLYADPIFSETGDFPAAVKERVAAKSAAQGFPRSRLPELTPEEVEYIRGTSDFFGLNHYSTYIVYRNESVVGHFQSPSFFDDTGVRFYQSTESQSTMYASWGFHKLLTKIREEYHNPPIFILENGFETNGGLTDDDRITYFRGYITAMLDAIDDGSDIRLYSVWSLMDSFEWMNGYTHRMGLYEVDYESPEHTHTPRKSAFVYKEIVRTRALDLHYEPDTTTMTIDEGH